MNNMFSLLAWKNRANRNRNIEAWPTSPEAGKQTKDTTKMSWHGWLTHVLYKLDSYALFSFHLTPSHKTGGTYIKWPLAGSPCPILRQSQASSYAPFRKTPRPQHSQINRPSVTTMPNWHTGSSNYLHASSIPTP